MQKPGLFGMNGFLLFLLTGCSFGLQAQQTGNLVLIDADNKLPFTVRVGDQLFASSVHGHLVIPHLKDSSYKLGVSFPKKTIAEQVFPIQVKQKDLGFQLQGSDSAWVLYNWQTKITIHPVKDRDSSRVLEMGKKREDGFSKLMAAVVDDTAVMYNTYTGNWFTQDSLNLISKTARASVPVPNANPGQPGQQAVKSADSSKAKISQPIANQTSTVLVPPVGQVSKQTTVSNKSSSKSQDSALVKTGKPLATTPPATAPIAKNIRTVGVLSAVKKIRDVNLKISRKMVFLDAGTGGKVDTVTLFVFFENKDSAKKQPAGLAAAKKKPGATDSTGTPDLQSKTSGAEIFIRGCGEQATTADVEWLRSAILKANSEAG